MRICHGAVRYVRRRGLRLRARGSDARHDLREHDRGPRPRLRPARRRDGRRPLGRERRPRVRSRAARRRWTSRDEALIRFLMRDRHGSPFEHNAFRFHIRCPIFVAREWFRHRVGSFNEFSLRYAKATDDFYVPERRGRPHAGRASPARTRFEPVDAELAEHTREQLQAVYEHGVRDLRGARRGGRRAGARPLGAAGRRLHPVLLDRERALADELRLAAELASSPSSRSAATPRRSRRSSPS